MGIRVEHVTFTHTFARRTAPAKTEVVVAAPAGTEVEITVVDVDGAPPTSVAKLSLADEAQPGEAAARFLFDGLASGTTLSVAIDSIAIGSSHVVPPVPFDAARLLASGTGAPFDRFGFGGRLDFTGPFLGFAATAATCADAHIIVHNRTSDERYWADADADGNLTMELSDTFPGDVLDVWVEDFSGHRSETESIGYIVPTTPFVSDAMRAAIEKKDVGQIVEVLAAAPNAAHRFVWEEFAATLVDDEHAALRTRAEALFENANQVRLHTTPRTSS